MTEEFNTQENKAKYTITQEALVTEASQLLEAIDKCDAKHAPFLKDLLDAKNPKMENLPCSFRDALKAVVDHKKDISLGSLKPGSTSVAVYDIHNKPNAAEFFVNTVVDTGNMTTSKVTLSAESEGPKTGLLSLEVTSFFPPDEDHESYEILRIVDQGGFYHFEHEQIRTGAQDGMEVVTSTKTSGYTLDTSTVKADQ